MKCLSKYFFTFFNIRFSAEHCTKHAASPHTELVLLLYKPQAASWNVRKLQCCGCGVTRE